MISETDIVVAMLKYGTAYRAAAELGVSSSTIYRRLKDSNVQALYLSAQADLLRDTVSELSDMRDSALAAIRQIMDDPETNAAVRLQAAQTVLNNDFRYSERLAQVETNANDMHLRADCEAYAMKQLKEQKELEKKGFKTW